ncbi:MAG: bifunctional diaminohydroxyphosphoribosylaminopyrimidine deaminase/5-amino-6-(5-phosphoribosylamino)uracil reductase RibD [Firmicutes bacterium]|nr:bifunctional diaminohydroxyphosphoribosylaminopyrimidine deaminase/5-amino-6-(5-phosphoribosylamino)uracil reductase RibD [Bacillota bacterium]
MTSRYMQRALTLARRGLGYTSPNPMVGAVVVNDAGDIVSEGYHAKRGGPHAEVAALKAAGARAQGHTLYVTLEPCNHTGLTPPCTEAIIQSGIRRVVIATRDPNPHVAGGGIERLRAANIAVEVGDGQEEAEALNRPFFTWSREHRPYLTLKAAVSLDGKVATAAGESKYLTSAPALQHAHELRRQHDAILVGSGTILQDNPRLTYRGRRRGRQPVRVVLDSRGRTPPDALVLDPEIPSPTLIFATEAAPLEWERQIFGAGGEVVRVGQTPEGHVNLAEVMAQLADRQILSVLVEGGPTVHAAFIQAGLADRWVLYLAPLILGGRESPTAVGGRGFDLGTAPRLTPERVHRLGPDVVWEGAFQPRRAIHESEEVACLPESWKPSAKS